LSCVELEEDEEYLDVVFEFEVTTEQTADFVVSLPSGSGPVALAVQDTCGLVTSEYGCWTDDGTVTGRLWRLLPGRYYLLAATIDEVDLEVSITLSPLDPGLFIVEDFAGVPSGWELSGAWEQGVPGGGGDPDPDAGGCIATTIGGLAPSGMTFATDYAQTPAIDLRGAVAPELQFRSWLQFYTYNSGAHLEVATDPEGPFTQIPTSAVSPAYDGTAGSSQVWYGERTTWADYSADLSAYVDQIIYIRFAAMSYAWGWGWGSDSQGWYVDSVMVIEP
jgi:hypothetical protein